MRVLHVIPSLGPARGGATSALETMARGLTSAGVEVHIATTDDNGRERLNVPLDVPVRRDFSITWYFQRQVGFYTISWPLARWLASHVAQYDLVHIHALFNYPSAVAAWTASRAGVPYVVGPLGTLNRWGMAHRRPLLKRLSFALLERRTLAGAAAIHYTSEQEQCEAAELGIDRPAVVIPLGLDPDAFESTSPKIFTNCRPQFVDRDIVLFLSRLDPKKGVDLLLLAFSNLAQAQPNAHLVLAGDGDRRFVDQLRRKADEIGLRGKVTFVGYLEGDIKRSALAAASAFVLPSHSENFGVAVAEAMAAGAPVIVSDSVALSSEVERTGAGIVVSLEAGEIARAIMSVLSDRERAHDMGRNAMRAARDRFSADVSGQQLAELYKSIIHPRICSVA